MGLHGNTKVKIDPGRIAADPVGRYKPNAWQWLAASVVISSVYILSSAFSSSKSIH
jgi:hypothetical protein